MQRGGPQAGELTKANRQLLLAAELTFDETLGERLADLAHDVGQLASDRDCVDDTQLESIERQLSELRADTHTDVRAAITRALELVSSHRRAPVST